MFAEVIHAADVLVPDLASCSQIVPKPFDRLFIRCDLGLDEFQRNFLFGLRVLDTVDTAHPALSQFFDDLVSFSE